MKSKQAWKRLHRPRKTKMFLNYCPRMYNNNSIQYNHHNLTFLCRNVFLCCGFAIAFALIAPRASEGTWTTLIDIRHTETSQLSGGSSPEFSLGLGQSFILMFRHYWPLKMNARINVIQNVHKATVKTMESTLSTRFHQTKSEIAGES